MSNYHQNVFASAQEILAYHPGTKTAVHILAASPEGDSSAEIWVTHAFFQENMSFVLSPYYLRDWKLDINSKAELEPNTLLDFLKPDTVLSFAGWGLTSEEQGKLRALIRAVNAGPEDAIHTHPRDSNRYEQNGAFAEACNVELIKTMILAGVKMK